MLKVITFFLGVLHYTLSWYIHMLLKQTDGWRELLYLFQFFLNNLLYFIFENLPKVRCYLLNKHCFALLCLCMAQQFKLLSTLMAVFPFLFSLFSKHNQENCTVRIALVTKWLFKVIIDLLFKLTLCKSKIHFFGLESCKGFTLISHIVFPTIAMNWKYAFNATVIL